MNKQEEEQKLNNKLQCIESQILKLQQDYEELFSQTIIKRESLREQRSSFKDSEVSSELKKINKYICKCNRINKKIRNLKISKKTPYFACLTFDKEEFYIGKLGVKDEKTNEILINDWRAPVSNLFYDFEIGPAYYIVPGVAKIEGIIENKKQYKIENSKMIYCFETIVNVEDDILQKTLAENSSEHMKTIVASIQKEQNQIIRKPKNETLIVQGVAGSGKTSIALHRIAYLLYNNKKTLKSNNVLIFSPNKVFSSYISTVLPELGESKAKETNFDEILQNNFGGIFDFYKKFENIELLLKSNKLLESHNKKTSLTFFNNLNNYLNSYLNSKIEIKQLKIKGQSFEEEQIIELFNQSSSNSWNDKLEKISSRILDIVNIQSPLKNNEENSLKSIIKVKLLKFIKPEDKNIVKIYSEFLKTENLLLKYKPKLYFDDAVCLLYIKNYIFGTEQNRNITHIVIDELQDYSPMALAIIQQLYPCTKTALGDIYQTVENTPNVDMIENATKILNATETPIKLTTVYRSTKQIAEFCNKLLNLKNIKVVNRNGKDVSIIKASKMNLEKILEEKINELKTKYKSIGIITKDYKQAYDIGKSLKIKTISPITQRFKTGVVSSPAYLAKGLEFDAVIVCDVSNENFKTELDKQQLYIACSRPLHELALIYSDEPSIFIK